MSFIATVLAVINIVFILLLAGDSSFWFYFDGLYGASLLVGAVPIAVFYMGSKQRISGKTKLDRRKEDDSTNA